MVPIERSEMHLTNESELILFWKETLREWWSEVLKDGEVRIV
jgi:hypothetical protein